MGGENHQQFLTFVLYRHDVHLLYPLLSKVVDGFSPVEHGREFQYYEIGFLQQLVAQAQHIGGAVADVVGAPSVLIATGRIKENYSTLRHLLQVVGAIGANHLAVESQNVEVVSSQLAEIFLLFYVGGFLKEGGKEREINTETASEVGEGFGLFCQGLAYRLFVTGGLLAAALLHRQVRGIKNLLMLCPGRKFLACGLSSGYLLECLLQVNFGRLAATKRQLPNVVVGMLAHVLKGCLVHQVL